MSTYSTYQECQKLYFKLLRNIDNYKKSDPFLFTKLLEKTRKCDHVYDMRPVRIVDELCDCSSLLTTYEREKCVIHSIADENKYYRSEFLKALNIQNKAYYYIVERQDTSFYILMGGSTIISLFRMALTK